MKKILAVILSSLIICAAAGCGSNQKSESASKAETTQAATEAVPEATVATASPAVSSDLEDTIKSHDFEGIIYAVKDGKPVASYAKGKLENGSEITLDSPMPVGSVSKQFCAAAVLLLQEQGKLNVNDTLDKFYPDYKEGKKITLKNVLSMRSGIPEITEEDMHMTDKEIEALAKKQGMKMSDELRQQFLNYAQGNAYAVMLTFKFISEYQMSPGREMPCRHAYPCASGEKKKRVKKCFIQTI